MHRILFPLSGLPPAAGFATVTDIFNAWLAVRQTLKESGKTSRGIEQVAAAVEDCLCKYYQAKEALLFGSGKEALATLFTTLARSRDINTIALSAYTCPDIAAAAVRAGLKILPIDIELNTLELQLEAISKPSLDSHSLLLSNLYGLPDTINAASSSFPVVIDDGCQSSLTETNQGVVGFRENTFGVTSFGRGKAFCGIGGGALLLPHSSLTRDLRSGHTFPTSSDSLPHALRDLTKAIAFRFLQRPELYGFISRLPGTGLGETHCDPYFEENTLSSIALYSVVAQIKNAASRQQSLLEKAKLWSEGLDSLPVVQPFIERGLSFSDSIAPIRYPVLLPQRDIRAKILTLSDKFGLGFSGSYPSPLLNYPELRESLVDSECRNASEIAGRIITLPTHQYVTKGDISVGIKLLEKFCK